ncbi:MAG: citrate/2-methylcitrate synthase, partial [Acidimicrobiales bacterium]
MRPANESGTDVPKGLEGVVVAETSVGDVRGVEGFYHYRQYSAVELASARSFEVVWYLLVEGTLPGPAEADAFRERVRSTRALPDGLNRLLPAMAGAGTPLEVLRSAVSLLGAELGWPPTHDVRRPELVGQSLQLGACVPTILAAAHRIRLGRPPVEPRADLGHAANYLWMLRGEEPTAEEAEAIEQYMVLTIDHGFNASTFVARTITSTGADLASAVCGAIGALSGPLHGGAPSRALEMVDAIGTPERARPWLEEAISRGDRIMGFGHRVYKTDDPRSAFLREKARALGGPTAELAAEIERTVLEVLHELKPGRRLYTNVEFYAGVVMDACGIPREMFTPTFA